MRAERTLAIAPPRLLKADSESNRPGTLTLVELHPEQIDCIMQTVPGEAWEERTEHPTTPLHRAVLFRHRLNEQSDMYVTSPLLDSKF